MWLKCKRCQREWDYKGNSKWYTNCPQCRTCVKVGNGDINGNEKISETKKV